VVVVQAVQITALVAQEHLVVVVLMMVVALAVVLVLAMV
jgi:hypothetical protein